MTLHTVAEANAAGDCQYVFYLGQSDPGSWERPARGGSRPSRGQPGDFHGSRSEAEDITTGSTRREDAGDVEVESPASRRRDIRLTIVPKRLMAVARTETVINGHRPKMLSRH